MPWKDFNYDGKVYPLDHLVPFTMQVERPVKEERPAQIFHVDVEFSLHCFTSQFPDTPFDAKLKYADSREVRMFDFDRYALSIHLPGIVRSLHKRKCLHTGHGNFVTVDFVNAAGETKQYYVFFKPSKSSLKGRLNLYIQSSYVPMRKVSHTRMPMNFLYILHNTLHGIPIRY